MPYPSYVRRNGNGTPLSSSGAQIPPTNEPRQQEAVSRLDEKVRSATFAGRVSFLPYLDPYTEETWAMRRMYPVMLRNPVVKQSLQHKVNSVASLDVQVTPAGDTARDSEVADFIRYWYVDAMEGGPVIAAQEVLYPSLIWKSVVAEKVWYGDLWPRGKFTGKRFYRCFKSKEQAEPIYDEFRNITGVRAQGNGQAETFAPDDFLVLKNWPLFGGPGMSDLRAAYLYLWQLDTAEKLHMIHLEKYLSPVLVASYDNGFEADGTLEGLESDLSKVRARSWMVVPQSVKVEAMQLAQRGEAEFLAKCQDLREQITLSITGAFLQMLTATSGTDMRGSSTVHKSTSELLIWELAARFAGALNSQAIPHLVRENYYGADYPKLSLGGINYGELLDAVKIDEAGQRMGAKFSIRAMSRKYGWQLAQDEADTLQPPPQQPPGGGFGGMPFSDPPDPEDPRSFCGGPGSGKPGPCPSGITEDDRHPFGGGAGERLGSYLSYSPHQDGLSQRLDHIYGGMKQVMPDLTPEEYKGFLMKARAAGAIELKVLNEVRDMDPAGRAVVPTQGENVYGYAMVRDRAKLVALLKQGRNTAPQAGIAQARAQTPTATPAAKGEASGALPPRMHQLLAGYSAKKVSYREFITAMESAPLEDRQAVARHLGIPPRDAELPASFTAKVLQELETKPVKFADGKDVALAGSDGAKAEQLLTHAQQQGAHVLADLTRAALSRLLRHGEGAMAQRRLFSAHERRRLALSLAATLGTSHLLGQARIRRRADQVEKHTDRARRFSDEATDMHVFDEGGPLAPMTPTAALDYFKKLVPGISGDPQRFGEDMLRQAFTLAVTTDEQLLSRVQGIIAERLQTGEGIDTAPAEIDALLEQAGVSPANPQYAEMVYRTNASDALNTGAWKEMQEVSDIFPAYAYANPSDSRSRPEHAERNGKLYSASLPFAEVRGTDIADIANCRCTFIPIDKFELEERLAAGEKLER